MYRAVNLCRLNFELGRGLGASVGGFSSFSGSRLPGIGNFPVGTDQKVLILAVHPGEKLSSPHHS